MVFLYHLRVVFTTTSVWVISTSVWLHLYPRTVGPSIATRFKQFLVELWVSPTLFVGFLFFQWVSFTACGVAGQLWVSPTLFMGFLFFQWVGFTACGVAGHRDCGFGEFSSSWWFFLYCYLCWASLGFWYYL